MQMRKKGRAFKARWFGILSEFSEGDLKVMSIPAGWMDACACFMTSIRWASLAWSVRLPLTTRIIPRDWTC